VLQSVFGASGWGTLFVRPSGAVLEEAVTRDRTTVTVIPRQGRRSRRASGETGLDVD
jgi:hypothetical protein